MKSSIFITIILVSVIVLPFSFAEMQLPDQTPDLDLQKTMTVKNPNGELSAMTFIYNNRAFTKIYSELVYDDVLLWSDFQILKEMGISEVDFLINCPGGSAFTGFSLSGVISWAQENGFSLKAHASGIVASAAVPVFLSFDNRDAMPGTIFMIHEPSSSLQGTATEFRSQNKLFDILRDQYFGILMDRTKIKDRDQWEEWERNTEWINMKRAKEIGIVPDCTGECK